MQICHSQLRSRPPLPCPKLSQRSSHTAAAIVLSRAPPLHVPGQLLLRDPAEMGSTSSMLTQYDIEEVQDHCSHAFSQQEIVSLYHRFCQLDRNGGGFVSAEEFMTVPEFAVNPLSQRLLRMLDGLNFKEYVAFLSAFSPHTSLQQKIEFIFRVYDTDCNGKVAFDDILNILRDLTGSFMTEQQRQKVLTHVLEEAGYTKDSNFTLPDFMKVLGNSDLKMEVEVPID